MEINPIGLGAAAAAFLGIWLGHVSVRILERRVARLWIPVAAAVLFGLSLEAVSLSASHRLLSAVSGILGITILWDAYELVRQEKRVRKGHAPANPANPRHAAILAAPNSRATRHELLNRDPVGRPVGASEAVRLVSKRGAP